MKINSFFLVLYVVLIGCVPSTAPSSQEPLSERPFTDTVIPTSRTTEAASNPHLREFATPNPAGQILDYTGWELKYAIINGELEELKAHEVLKIYFNPDSVGLYDGCNHMSYRYAGGRPGYVATENGEFIYPLKESKEDGAYDGVVRGIVRVSTELYCFQVDEESGEEITISVPEFLPPYENIVAYELSADQLHLYYPENKQNVLVFERLTIQPQPTETSIQEPEPTATPQVTATTEATATAIPEPYPGPPTNEATAPASYPGPIPIPPTPTPLLSYP